MFFFVFPYTSIIRLDGVRPQNKIKKFFESICYFSQIIIFVTFSFSMGGITTMCVGWWQLTLTLYLDIEHKNVRNRILRPTSAINIFSWYYLVHNKQNKWPIIPHQYYISRHVQKVRAHLLYHFNYCVIWSIQGGQVLFYPIINQSKETEAKILFKPAQLFLF